MKKISAFIEKIKTSFVEWLFPEHIKCLGCGDDLPKLNTFDLCDECKESLQLNNGRRCAKCGKNVVANASYCFNCKNNIRHFDKAAAPLLYVGLGARLIKQFKYKNSPYLATTFARILAQEYAKSDFDADVVVPVPMHIDKVGRRGYNQAELLAIEFCKIVDLPIDTTSLIKIVDTDTQTHKTKDEREDLSKVYFLKNKDAFKGKKVLLIDDVITTGSTMDACSEKLRAKKVFCLAIAHSKLKVRAVSTPSYLDNKKYRKKIAI